MLYIQNKEKKISVEPRSISDHIKVERTGLGWNFDSSDFLGH